MLLNEGTIMMRKFKSVVAYAMNLQLIIVTSLICSSYLFKTGLS